MSEFIEFQEFSLDQTPHPLERIRKRQSDLSWVSWVPSTDPDYTSREVVSARRELEEINCEEVQYRQAYPQEAGAFDQALVDAQHAREIALHADDGWDAQA